MPRSFWKPGDGEEIRLLPGLEPVNYFEHYKPVWEHPGFNGQAVVPCKPDWRTCRYCIFFAQSRGLNIHSLRVALAHRHRHGDMAPAMRELARSSIARLRELGPGNVLMPDEHLGEPLDWWGPHDAS